MSSTQVIQADYHNTKHAQIIISLLNDYALDPMGGGKALSNEVKHTLTTKLAERDDAITLLAITDSGDAVGLLNAFEGFSTFAAAPLLNIHDVYVTPTWRGKGIARTLFSALEVIAKKKSYCKLTLEVLSLNETAKRVYQSLGFHDYTLQEASGTALFWQKEL